MIIIVDLRYISIINNRLGYQVTAERTTRASFRKVTRRCIRTKWPASDPPQVTRRGLLRFRKKCEWIPGVKWPAIDKVLAGHFFSPTTDQLMTRLRQVIFPTCMCAKGGGALHLMLRERRENTYILWSQLGLTEREQRFSDMYTWCLDICHKP